MLEEINKAVQEKANNSQSQIIIEVYKNMLVSHNEFCGCNYCVILNDYVRMKKYLSTKNRQINNPDYNFCDKTSVVYNLNNIKKIREAIKKLKHDKDILKII